MKISEYFCDRCGVKIPIPIGERMPVVREEKKGFEVKIEIIKGVYTHDHIDGEVFSRIESKPELCYPCFDSIIENAIARKLTIRFGGFPEAEEFKHIENMDLMGKDGLVE